eukprot:Rmarinus@m.14749
MEAHRAPPETLRMFEEEAEIEPVSFEAPQLPLPAVEYFSEGELEFPAAPVLSPRPEMDMEMSPPPAEVSIQPAWPEEELPEVPLMRETRKRKRSQQGLQVDNGFIPSRFISHKWYRLTSSWNYRTKS